MKELITNSKSGKCCGDEHWYSQMFVFSSKKRSLGRGRGMLLPGPLAQACIYYPPCL